MEFQEADKHLVIKNVKRILIMLKFHIGDIIFELHGDFLGASL